MDDLIPWPYALFIAAGVIFVAGLKYDMFWSYIVLAPPLLLLLLIIYGESYRTEVEKK